MRLLELWNRAGEAFDFCAARALQMVVMRLPGAFVEDSVVMRVERDDDAPVYQNAECTVDGGEPDGVNLFCDVVGAPWSRFVEKFKNAMPRPCFIEAAVPEVFVYLAAMVGHTIRECIVIW